MQTAIDAPLSEASLQACVFQYFWNYYPETRRLIFHVPNGGSRNKIEAVRLRAQGVVRGIPDLICLTASGMIAIELKIPGGTISPDQLKVHQVWREKGYRVYVCWTEEQAKEVIMKEFNLCLIKS